MSADVKLSEETVAWADRKIAAGEYPDRTAYFEAVVMQERAYEEKLAELRRLIDEGIASGVSDKTVDDVWREVCARHGIDA